MLWSQSMVARLMVPVALMLGLVCILGLIGLGTRSRVQTARDAANAGQVVRIHLIEVRSLSRSLQRDALNLLLERDRRELTIIHGKFSNRSNQMRAELGFLVRNRSAGLTRQSAYIRS
jgi:methyl-accepting chemotaxis protein